MFLLLILFVSINASVKANIHDITQQFNPETAAKIAGDYEHNLREISVTDLLEELQKFEPLGILKTPELALKTLLHYNNPNVSTPCLQDFVALAFGLVDKNNSWAWKMLDAYGKVESGITQGNIVWPGRFSVCNNITQGPPYYNETKPFVGQYCWVTAAAGEKVPLSDDVKKLINLRVGVCIPDSCVPNDLNTLVQDINNISSLKQYFTVASECIPASRNIWDDNRAVICLVFCMFIAVIILSATVYDAYLRMSFSNSQYLKKNEIQSSLKSHESLAQETDDELCINADDNQLISNKDENKPGICGQILLSFSFYTNAEKLFNTTPRDKSLMCLNGIRVFSIIWIILGHTYLAGLGSNNLLDAFLWTQKFSFLFIYQAEFSVDTFFVLSGLLVTYLYLHEHKKRNGKISWLKFYFHRYWRLTPVYAVVLFIFYDILSPYYINGPFWSQQGVGNQCDDYWWSNLFYFNNFIKNNGCMGHTWYLANDMQFYIISPLILIFLTRCLPISAIIAASLILASWITTGVISTYNHLTPNLTAVSSFDVIYNKPYCRIGPYIIGMICGYLLYRNRCQAKLNKMVVGFGWLIAAGISSAVVFGIYKVDLSQEVASLYLALSRSAWSVALAWMIFACCNGYGGFLNSILSWPFWQPLGRLTYSTYLIHIAIITVFENGTEVAIHFSHILMVAYFFASTVCSYIAAIFLSLCFEAPFMALEKIFL